MKKNSSHRKNHKLLENSLPSSPSLSLRPPLHGFFLSRIIVWFLAAAFSLSTVLPLFADYPLINHTITSRDALYSQQQDDIESWYTQDKKPSPLQIFRYIPGPSEDLFSVAAAFNLPYEAIASLNSWDSPALLRVGSALLIPNAPGLFIPESPQGNWEQQLAQYLRKNHPQRVSVTLSNEKNRNFFYYPGESLRQDERRRFLSNFFSSPLEETEITSSFGYRLDPFTGARNFHSGLDLRAPLGSPVRAARQGYVVEKGRLEIYGTFVILNHGGRYYTIYSHLQKILLEVGQEVVAGDIIALSGDSGISTGPHLHFEIRRDGKPIDPEKVMNFH